MPFHVLLHNLSTLIYESHRVLESLILWRPNARYRVHKSHHKTSQYKFRHKKYQLQNLYFNSCLEYTKNKSDYELISTFPRTRAGYTGMIYYICSTYCMIGPTFRHLDKPSFRKRCDWLRQFTRHPTQIHRQGLFTLTPTLTTTVTHVPHTALLKKKANQHFVRTEPLCMSTKNVVSTHKTAKPYQLFEFQNANL